MIFGLLLVPMVFAVGMGIDYTSAARKRSQLNAAADAAVLAAVRTASQQLQAGASNWNALGVTVGQNFFSGNSSNIPNIVINTPTISISQSGTTVTANLSYTAQVKTAFAKIIGTSTINIGNSTTASSGVVQYTNVYIVIDNSESMGIGSTAADQQTMYNVIGCTVACHYTDVYGDVDNVAQARASGATLRIDVAKTGVINALNLLNSSPNATYFQVAIYTMSNGLTAVYPLSNISGAISAVNGIDLAQVTHQGGTNTTYSLQQLNSILPTPGNGLSASTAAGVVLIMTDGVQDATYEEPSSTHGEFQVIQDPNWVPYSPYQAFPVFGGDPIEEGFQASACAAIKTKGYTVETLYATYLVPTIGNSADDVTRFNFITSSLLPLIPGSLSTCATSAANAYSATTPSDIVTAFAKMILSVEALHLSH
ncbi:MAG: vWA domain-containing protein [Beijerinckiaceae bacterium]